MFMTNEGRIVIAGTNSWGTKLLPSASTNGQGSIVVTPTFWDGWCYLFNTPLDDFATRSPQMGAREAERSSSGRRIGATGAKIVKRYRAESRSRTSFNILWTIPRFCDPRSIRMSRVPMCSAGSGCGLGRQDRF